MLHKKIFSFIQVILFSLIAFAVNAAFAATPETVYVYHPIEVFAGEPFTLQINSTYSLDGVEVAWRGKTIPLAGQGNKAECMLSVPLGCSEKEIKLTIQVKETLKPLYESVLSVKHNTYAVQELKVDPKFVVPPANQVERIKRERERNRNIYSIISPKRFWESDFNRPVPGIVTSNFGLRRLFNGQPRSQHRGVDLRGAEGSPITSFAAGQVVLAEEQYYSGNVLVIDHGLGVFSLYAHLSEFKVEKGSLVKAGELIGLVGKTGRVTGPHLHFSLIVLGESVDPAVVIPTLRANP